MEFRVPSARPCYDEYDREILEDVLDSAVTAEADQARQLIRELGSLVGPSRGVLAPSGTTAFHLFLRARNIGPGDQVILPSYTCQSLLHPVHHVGAEPVLADVDPESFCLTAETIAPHVTDQTKLVLLVHTFGYPAGSDELFEFGIPVLEDLAQSLGARRNSSHVGQRGLAAMGSLYATKQLAAGQGGFLLTEDQSLAAELKDLKNYDERDDYRPAFNASLSDLLCALARSQLEKLPQHQERRRRISDRYDHALEDLEAIKRPQRPSGHAQYRYVIRTEQSRSLAESCRAEGIEVKRPVYRPLHQDLDLSGYPVSQELHETALLLPNHPGLTDQQVQLVIDRVRSQVRDGSCS